MPEDLNTNQNTNPDNQPPAAGVTPPADPNTNPDNILDNDEVKKLIQSSNDKIRTEYSLKVKELETKMNDLLKKDLSKEDQLKLKENSLREYEVKLQQKELEFETLRLLEKENLPSDFLSFIPGNSIEEKQNHLKTLKTHINSFVEETTKSKFKELGTDFKGSSSQQTSGKKWEEMTITERIQFAESNPEEAAKYL